MAGNPEVRSKGVNFYNNLNKGFLVAEIGVAVFVPVLRAPALLLAAANVVEITIIDNINKKKPAASNNESRQLKADNVVSSEQFQDYKRNKELKKQLKQPYVVYEEQARKTG